MCLDKLRTTTLRGVGNKLWGNMTITRLIIEVAPGIPAIFTAICMIPLNYGVVRGCLFVLTFVTV